MSKIVWDETGKRIYETGIKMGVLYPSQSSGLYNKGVAWNGLTAVTENPSGAESSPQYADNIKYLNLVSAEEFGATIEAFTYPDEFAVCDGSVELDKGLMIGQQKRKTFGLSYRTAIGNDVDGVDYGYKLHLIYGALAAPSEKGYSTMNDSPEAITFSWEVTTTPVSIKGFKPTASITIDSNKVDPDKLNALELILYGSENTEARLLLPDEVLDIFKSEAPVGLSVSVDPEDKITEVIVSKNIVLTFNNKVDRDNIILMSSTGTLVPTVKEFDTTGKILTINPKDDLLPATTYLINIIGVTDIYNQTLEPKIVSFTTA